MSKKKQGLRVSIFNPTGNITALVEDQLAPEEQPSAARRVMDVFPSVEQVGFVRLPEKESEPVELRMAGGEFCGNASMSAAAFGVMRRGGSMDTRLRVFGVSREVKVRLSRCFLSDLYGIQSQSYGQKESLMQSLHRLLPFSH